MNSIITNRNLPIFKPKKEEPKKKLSPSFQRIINKENSNKILKNYIKKMTKTIRFLNVPEDLKNLLTKKENEDKVKTSRMLFSKDNNSLQPSTI